jgi:hypothetical protein
VDEIGVLRWELVIERDENGAELEISKGLQEVRILEAFETQVLHACCVFEPAFLELAR